MFDRIGRDVKRKMVTPSNKNVLGTKLQGLKQQIEAGDSIMSTHSLFLNLDNEAVELLKQRNYTLVIDEAIDAVSVISGKKASDGSDDDSPVEEELKSRITLDDINWLKSHGLIYVDRNNYNTVVWSDNTKSDDLAHRYRDVEQIVRTGAVSFANDTFLLWSFPIRTLDAFNEIVVLTYRFQHSIMRGYFDFYGKPYVHKTVTHHGDDYCLTDFCTEVETGKQYADLINICQSDRLNAVGLGRSNCRFPLSSTSYAKDRKNGGNRRTTLKNNVTNYFRHYCNADRDSVMWTTFKAHKKAIKPQGYSLRSDNTESFVSSTCRATNQYVDRYNLAYLVDKHIHPGIQAFFRQRNVVVDNDEYALSEMIQWIFRSRIRNTDVTNREINIYIPSEHMRGLLMDWMGA